MIPNFFRLVIVTYLLSVQVQIEEVGEGAKRKMAVVRLWAHFYFHEMARIHPHSRNIIIWILDTSLESIITMIIAEWFIRTWMILCYCYKRKLKKQKVSSAFYAIKVMLEPNFALVLVRNVGLRVLTLRILNSGFECRIKIV